MQEIQEIHETAKYNTAPSAFIGLSDLENIVNIENTKNAKNKSSKNGKHVLLLQKDPLLKYDVFDSKISRCNDEITISDLTDMYQKYLLNGEEWHLDRTKDNVSQYSAHVSHKNTIGTIFRVFFDLLDEPVSNFTNSRFRQWCSDYITRNNISPSTMNRSMTCLRGMFTWAAQYGYLSGPKLRGIKLFKETSANNISRRCLSSLEIKHLVKALDRREKEKRMHREKNNKRLRATGHPEIPPYLPYGEGYCDYVYPMVMLSLLTGGRKGSVRGLKWHDLDFDNDTVIFQGEHAKSGRSIIVPMTPKLKTIMLMWKKQKNIGDSYADNDRFVFEAESGMPLESSSPRCWHQLLDNAGITNFRWHDMRHTYASTLAASGVDIVTLKELMGHSNIRTTSIYLHTSPKYKRDSVRILDKLMI